MKNLLCAFIVFIVVMPCLGGEKSDPNDPNAMLSAAWGDVIEALGNKELDDGERDKKIEKIVDSLFDFTLMGKLALGRKHWPKLSEGQVEKFIELFTERLKDLYREKVTLYTNEEGSFKPAISKGSSIHIPMQLVSGETKIELLYKLRKTENRWKIYDLEIQGVSVLLTYRSQFDDILSHGTVEDLLAKLERPTAE